MSRSTTEGHSPTNSPAFKVALSDHVDLESLSIDDDGKVSLPESKVTTQEKKEEEVSKFAAKSGFYDVRVAVVGNVDSGKSTLTGVLVSGKLDDGRGAARSKIFIHPHEQATGRTSSQSHHILGFADDNTPIHQTVPASASAAQKTKGWASVVSSSRNTVTFIDLCGHEMYLRTTIAGLTGGYPDYAIVIVNALAGISKMTKEHLGVVLALGVPLCIVVTKMDLVPQNVLERTKLQLFKILKSPAANKLPLHVRSEKDIDTVIQNNDSYRICPVFFVSCVTGVDIPLLTAFLARIKPRTDWQKNMPSFSEFHIDETFQVSGVGLIVSGSVVSGVIKKDQNFWLGPYLDNSWVPVSIRSLHVKRVPTDECAAPLSCAVSIRPLKRKDVDLLRRHLIRKGMVLIDAEACEKQPPVVSRVFEAEVIVLHHPTTIQANYQAVIHCGQVRQTAQIVGIKNQARVYKSKDAKAIADENKQTANASPLDVQLHTGDKALVTFRFLKNGEYLHKGVPFIFREGGCKGIGKISRLQNEFSDAEMKEIEQMEKNLVAWKRKKYEMSLLAQDQQHEAAETTIQQQPAAELSVASTQQQQHPKR